MITAYTGLPGSGKTTMLAREALAALKAAKAFHLAALLKDEQAPKRLIVSNIRFSEAIENEYHEYIQYFTEVDELVSIRHADLFIDELSLYFDAVHWEDMSLKARHFFRMHRHYGVEIYGVAQEFKDIHTSIRRLTKRLYYMDEIFGTESPDITKKARKHPFLLTTRRTVPKDCYASDSLDYYFIRSRPFLFTKKIFSVFDTLAELDIDYNQRLRHITAKCKDCGYEKVIHKV